MEPPKTIIFEGHRYNRDKKNYYHRGGGRGTLHRAIWESHNGPIPDGYHIHHINHDRLDNSIENLQCLTPSDHYQIHAEWRRNNPRPPSSKQKSAAMMNIKKAQAWAKTDDGKRILRENGKKIIASRPKVKKVCEVCGETYKTNSLKKEARRCSGRCNAKARRDSGIDDIRATCPICGKSYGQNKHLRQKTCSRHCGYALQSLHFQKS